MFSPPPLVGWEKFCPEPGGGKQSKSDIPSYEGILLADVQFLISSRHFEIHPKTRNDICWNLGIYLAEARIRQLISHSGFFSIPEFKKIMTILATEILCKRGSFGRKLKGKRKVNRKLKWTLRAPYDCISSLLAGLRKMSTSGGSSSSSPASLFFLRPGLTHGFSTWRKWCWSRSHIILFFPIMGFTSPKPPLELPLPPPPGC